MSEFRDQLKVEGVNARGYGVLPKMIMLDKQITIEAKAIYAYFCSYAGNGTTAFPSTSKIQKDLGVGKNRYYKHFNMLKELGYIKVDQIRNTTGVFKHNIYTLVTNPEPILEEENNKIDMDKKDENNKEKPSIQNEDTVTNPTKSASKPRVQNRDTVKRDTVNEDTNSNKSFNNNTLLYNQSVNQRQTDEMENKFKNILKNAEINQKNFPESFLPIRKALEILYFSDEEIKINNINTTKNQRQNDLEFLDSFHVEMAFKNYDEQLEKQIIKNKLLYLAICIYTAMFDADLSVRNNLKYENY